MIINISKTILFISVILNVCLLQANTDNHYKIDNRIILQKGLSQSRITSIIEDERGFMWFGTADGLNRYDGYTVKIFRNIPNDTTSLYNNNINSMVEDDQGNIWIGTNNGISVFNPYTEVFKSFKVTDSTSSSSGINYITSCVVDNNNDVWYCAKGYGVFKINPITLEKEELNFNTTDSLYLKDVNYLYVDRNNNLWIASYIGNSILTYSIDKGSFEKYQIPEIVNTRTKRLYANSFFEDNKGRIWLSIIDYDGKEGSLFYLEQNQKTFHNYKQFLTKEFIKENDDRLNTIVSMTQYGNEIWFTSLLGGIFKFEFGEIPIIYYKQSPNKDASINCIYKSKNDILWIGTNGNGIEMSVPNNTDFKLMNSTINNNFTIESIRAFEEDNEHYWVGGYYGLSKIKKDFSEVNTLQDASVYSIANSIYNTNILWTGSEGGGLQPLNKKTNVFKELEINSHINANEIYSHVYVIHSVNDTLLLLGTFYGLFGYNPLSNSITQYPAFCNITNSEVKKTVRTIYKDKLGNVLIGFTQGGIGKVDFNKRRIERFDLFPHLECENDYNPVNCIYNDTNDVYWIATNYSLIMVDVMKDKYQSLTENDGLPNSHIYGILPDEEGNLWLSTNNGISCYNPRDSIFKNFDINDGLQNNEFNTGAYFKAKDGTLFFGGINGFNYFNPKHIKQNSIIPKLVITKIKVSNKAIHLNKQETNNNKLIVKPSSGAFSIEFAGLSFINCTNNRYKYRLKELNSDWIDIGTHHKITFNSIDPGTHTLEILASNNHGLWLKEPYRFTIIKHPTFFESIGFKWILLALLIIVVFFGYKIRLRRITKQKDNLKKFADQQTSHLLVSNNTLKDEIQKHKATSKELQASNLTKDKFLSIIAHDIINPLGVIVGFSDILTDKSNKFEEKDKYSFIKTINITSKGLTTLLSNILQWSRIQSGSINPNPVSFEINKYINDTILLLQGNIEEKNINLHVNIGDDNIVFADPDMFSTIVRNLISNAIKFTPFNGTIIINSKHLSKLLEISIIDTGVGIPKENISKLFNTNNNFSTKGTNNESGTGLGLGLVYEFVNLNGGKIRVVSEVGKGSEFCFSLPIGELK